MMILNNHSESIHAYSGDVSIILDKSEEEAKHTDTILMVESISYRRVMNILMNHMKLQWVGHTDQGVLGPHLVV